MAATLPFGLDGVSFAGSAALLARLPRTRREAGQPKVAAVPFLLSVRQRG